MLTPPELPIDKVPVVWYNAGGVLANILVVLFVLPILFLNPSPFAAEFTVIFILTDVLLIVLNGVPMKINGIGNDGYNILNLRNNPVAKRAIILQLRANALIQKGVRPKDMPAEWFEETDMIDFGNSIEVAIPLMRGSRFVDELEFEKAYGVLSTLYAERNKIMPLYVKEIACELIFVCLVTDRKSVAMDIMDDKLMNYVNSYRKVMSSKDRLLCAIRLFCNGDRPGAEDLRKELEAKKDGYLLKGEVMSDLALMDMILDNSQRELE